LTGTILMCPRVWRSEDLGCGHNCGSQAEFGTGALRAASWGASLSAGRMMRPICDHECLERPGEGRRRAEMASVARAGFVPRLQQKTARDGEVVSAPDRIRTCDLRFRRPVCFAGVWSPAARGATSSRPGVHISSHRGCRGAQPRFEAVGARADSLTTQLSGAPPGQYAVSVVLQLGPPCWLRGATCIPRKEH